MTIEKNGGLTIMTIRADVFVVPIITEEVADSYEQYEQLKQPLSELAARNGIEFDPETDKLVRLWWRGKGVGGGSNLSDLGMTADDNRIVPMISVLPVSLFEGKKEKDEFELIVPPSLVKARDNHAVYELHIQARLRQDMYRYKGYGPFERALNYIITHKLSSLKYIKRVSEENT